MRTVTPRWAAGGLGLLLGAIMLLGLDRSGAFSTRPPQTLSGWGVVVLLAGGSLLGLAAATYLLGGWRELRSGRSGGAATAALRAVLAAAPQAIIAIDSGGNVTMWSPAAAKMLGWGPEEVLARPLPLVLEEDRAGARPLAQAVREGGTWSGTEVRSRRKDGAAVAVRVWATPVSGASQSQPGFVLTIEETVSRQSVQEHTRRKLGEAVNAILSTALHATDLRSLLDGVIDRTLEAVGVTAGGVWVEQVGVARGFGPDVGTAIVLAVQQRTRERPGPVGVADWRAAPADAPAGMADHLLAHGVRASIITSFTSKAGHAGGVVVAAADPRSWTPEELAMIDAVGAVLAEATDRLYLLEDAQQRLHLLDRARAIGKLLSRPAAIADVAKNVGEGAMALGGADRAAVYLCQPDGTLAASWSQNLSSTYVDQVLHYAKLLATGRMMDGAKPDLLELSGRGIEASAPVLYPDVQALPPAVLVPRLTQAEGYRGLGNWPLVYEGKILGLLSCYHDAPRTWSAPEQDVFQMFAQEAAFALHNARLHDAQMQRAADLEVLFDLSRRLRAARNPEEIYPILVGHAVDLLHADSGTLTLLAAQRAEFDCVYAAGMPPEVRGATFPVSGSPLGRVAQAGATFRTMNFGGEPLPVWMNGFRGIGPAVIVPVRSEEQTIGVFCLGRKRRSDANPFADNEVRLLEGMTEIGGTAIRRARLFQNLEKSYMQMVISLARTMDVRDSYTSGHSERISEWAEAVAGELGCMDAEIQDIRWGALLHDIGKIGVPDAILRKPGKLTDAEWAIMRKHPEIGEEILASTERMRGVATLVRNHQEKWDGTGYPDGLEGEEIPLGARILSVCDAYSAITDDRPYKKARTHEEATAELHRCAGAQFDPHVVEVFCRIVDRPREREKVGRPR